MDQTNPDLTDKNVRFRWIFTFFIDFNHLPKLGTILAINLV